MPPSRRRVLATGMAASAAFAAADPILAGAPSAPVTGPLGRVFDTVRTQHVMDIVATCSSPEKTSPGDDQGPDGQRGWIWPILGGRFEGIGGLRGHVVPGGGDFPVLRPDGVMWVEALYRLRADDGTTIVIHNKGLYVEHHTRLTPTFTVTQGRHDWLNRSLFIATLVEEVPASMRLARGPDENDRLIQVHRVC